MGKVLLQDGYRITINTNDHSPPRTSMCGKTMA